MPNLSRVVEEYVEYRGVKGLVAAEILTDDDVNGYTTGPVFAIAGVAEITKTTESSSEAHPYDNFPAIIIDSEGPDELGINTAAIPLNVVAKITGQLYDDTLGTFFECERRPPYFAIGYITEDTSGNEVYVWRYKGKFSVPDQTHITKNDSTDANGQELTYMGIATASKFSKIGRQCKATNVELKKDLVDVSNFFDEVTTPDTLQPKNPPVPTTYTLSITEGGGTTVEVMRSGVELMDGAKLNAGDVLTITVVGGTVTVNGSPFTSGDTYTVTGDVSVVSSY